MKISFIFKFLLHFKSNIATLKCNKSPSLSMQMVLVKNSPVHFQSGFTLIEMLVVIIIVGILSAIAAPSWLNFVAQRRANVINDAVLQAIRQAQSEAKKNKLSYSVSFKSTNQVPEVAIYPNNSTAIWGNLVKDSSIKPGQLLLGTNITGIDTVSTTITYGSTTSQTISFDYSGNLSSSGLINSVIAVGIPTANNSTTILESTRRCVKIVTLLGSMQTEQTSKCNP